MKTMKALILALVLGGCGTDDPPLPTCEEIQAPDTIACNAHGLCEWEGMQCCRYPRPGTEIDPACVSVLQPR